MLGKGKGKKKRLTFFNCARRLQRSVMCSANVFHSFSSWQISMMALHTLTDDGTSAACVSQIAAYPIKSGQTSTTQHWIPDASSSLRRGASAKHQPIVLPEKRYRSEAQRKSEISLHLCGQAPNIQGAWPPPIGCSPWASFAQSPLTYLCLCWFVEKWNGLILQILNSFRAHKVRAPTS